MIPNKGLEHPHQGLGCTTRTSSNESLQAVVFFVFARPRNIIGPPSAIPRDSTNYGRTDIAAIHVLLSLRHSARVVSAVEDLGNHARCIGISDGQGNAVPDQDR